MMTFVNLFIIKNLKIITKMLSYYHIPLFHANHSLLSNNFWFKAYNFNIYIYIYLNEKIKIKYFINIYIFFSNISFIKVIIIFLNIILKK